MINKPGLIEIYVRYICVCVYTCMHAYIYIYAFEFNCMPKKIY